MFRLMLDLLAGLAGKIADLGKEIARRAREDEASRRLMTVPGIGPRTQSASPVPTSLRPSLPLYVLGVSAAVADQCPQKESPIVTDRPDVTNSSLVVPQGSFQSENGINFSQQHSTHEFDGMVDAFRHATPVTLPPGRGPMLAAEMDGKRASLLHDFVPSARRFAILTGRPPRQQQRAAAPIVGFLTPRWRPAMPR
jgi:hypothetical protein